MHTSLIKSTMALLLAGGMALAVPVHARHGADDPPNHDAGDDKGGQRNDNADDKGGGNGKASAGKLRLRLPIGDSDAADTTRFRGKFRLENRGNRSLLRVDVKLKDALDLADEDAADGATVVATFADTGGNSVECELDLDEFRRNRAEYHLRLRQRGGQLSEKDGDCGGVLPPVVSGGSLTVNLEVPSADPDAPVVRTVGSLTFP